MCALVVDPEICYSSRTGLGRGEEALASIVKDAVRAGDVVSRIRDLMKKTPPRKDLLDVNRVVREVIELTEPAQRRLGVGERRGDGLVHFLGN